MAESYTKKGFLKKKLEKQKIKEEKRIFRKTNNNKGKPLEEMIIYVDINGHFTDVPPHLQEKENDLSKKKLYQGVVSHLNEKGFGFIKENESKESVFFSVNVAEEVLKINDAIEFTKVKGDRGFKAIKIYKINN